VDEKPQDLEQGLRLAYPDLDKRTVMIQTPNGFLVFRNGKKEQQSYDERIRTEAGEARDLLKKTAALYEEAGSSVPKGTQGQLDKQDEALKKVEGDLSGPTGMTASQRTADRAALAAISSALEDLYWRCKTDLLLASLGTQK
jgi:hypothetical protein